MIYLLIASILWSFSFGLIKYNLSGVNSFLLAFARLFLSFILFLPFFKKDLFRDKNFNKYFLWGAIQFGLMYEAYILSFNYLLAHEVALFTIITPLYVSLYQDLLNKKLNPNNLLFAFMSVIGAGVIVFSKLLSTNLWIGILLVQISNICFALGQINYKLIKEKTPGINDNQAMLIMYAGAVVVASVFSLIFIKEINFSFSIEQIVIIIYLGLIASGVGFFLWNFGASKVNAGTLSTFNNLKIPLGIVVSLIVFNEKADFVKLTIGSLLIILSIIFSNKFGANHAKN